MKTIAWTPTLDITSAEFSIDDEVIFSGNTSQTTKRLPLIDALLAAGEYAGMNLGFEIRNTSQDVLVVFEPNQSVKGYPAILEALHQVAAHFDNHAKIAVGRAMENIKPELVRVYEQAFVEGVLAERAHWMPAPEVGDGANAGEGDSTVSEGAGTADGENAPAVDQPASPQV